MGGEGAVKVVIRVRPEVSNDIVLSRSRNVSNKICVHTHDHLIKIEKDQFHFRDFSFEDILGISSCQGEVYQRSCEEVVETFTRDGGDGCVMCYGQSGSGKTFTMFGRGGSSSAPESSFGLVQNSMKDIFNYVNNCKGANFSVKIYVSFYEIYLEKITDLLSAEEKPGGLSIREMPGQGAHVEGLTRVLVSDFEAGLRLVRDMKHSRTSKKSQCNSASSRSHAVLRITMEHWVSSYSEQSTFYCYTFLSVFLCASIFLSSLC